jgi:hypothetical protein
LNKLWPDPNLCYASAANAQCSFYTQITTPVEIGTFESQASTPEEWAKQWAGIDNYDPAGGANNLTNSDALMNTAGSMGAMGGGTLFYGGMALGMASAWSTRSTLPREAGQYDIRWYIDYQVKEVSLGGREIYYLGGRNPTGPYAEQWLRLRRGTGTHALDTMATNPYGGTDSIFYGDINQMSYHRWLKSIMPCMKPAFCNSVRGLSMQQGWEPGNWAIPGPSGHCRYYKDWTESTEGGCPCNSVPRQTYEFQETYAHALEHVYPMFHGGVNELPVSTSLDTVDYQGVTHYYMYSFNDRTDIYGVDCSQLFGDTSRYVIGHACFHPDTLLTSEYGNPIRMGDVKVGDRIIGRNENGRTVVTVKHVMRYDEPGEEVYRLALSDDTVLVVTGGHLLHNGMNWVPVRELKTGDVLGNVTVLENRITPYTGEVIDLEVDQYHTYMVFGSVCSRNSTTPDRVYVHLLGRSNELQPDTLLVGVTQYYSLQAGTYNDRPWWKGIRSPEWIVIRERMEEEPDLYKWLIFNTAAPSGIAPSGVQPSGVFPSGLWLEGSDAMRPWEANDYTGWTRTAELTRGVHLQVDKLFHFGCGASDSRYYIEDGEVTGIVINGTMFFASSSAGRLSFGGGYGGELVPSGVTVPNTTSINSDGPMSASPPTIASGVTLTMPGNAVTFENVGETREFFTVDGKRFLVTQTADASSEFKIDGLSVTKDIYVFVRVYNNEGVQPSGSPWCVRLRPNEPHPSEPNTLMPFQRAVGFPFVVENEVSFKGGAAPEYKDLSKRGDEVLEEVGDGDGLQGDSGVGDPSTWTREPGYIMGYWVDKTGEWILDGRNLGPGTPTDEDRLQNQPKMVDDATPITSTPGTTIITPDGERRSNACRHAAVYSNDTDAILAALANIENSEGDKAPPMYNPAGLPNNREGLYCSACNITLHERYDGIVTTCPWCGSTLSMETLRQFPTTNALGRVTVWAPPGTCLGKETYFWQNPQLVNGDLVRQMRFKLGMQNTTGGGGYTLVQGACEATEHAVPRMMPGKGYWLPIPSGDPNGMPLPAMPSGFAWPGITEAEQEKYFSYNPMEDTVLPSGFDWGTDLVNRKVIAPYWASASGLRMVTLTDVQIMRNMIEPVQAYVVGREPSVRDCEPDKAKYGDRRTGREPKTWAMKPGTVTPQILAATTQGGSGYIQYWDGKFPGTCVREYTPPGPEYWRLHNIIGGIVRSGGTNAYHMDAQGPNVSTMQGYHGDELHARAFFFLHGALPLNKEILKAYAIIQPTFEPDFPEIGIVWSGGNFHWHWHPFTVYSPDGWGNSAVKGSEPESHETTYPKYQKKRPVVKRFRLSKSDQEVTEADFHQDLTIQPQSWLEVTGKDIFENTISYKPIVDWKFAEQITRISTYDDTSHAGWSDPWAYVTWAGMGSDPVQVFTEDEIWKQYTFQQFRDMCSLFKTRCEFFCEDESNRTSYTFDQYSIDMLTQILPEQMQPIPGFFDLSGMNSAMKYPRTVDVAEQQYDDLWAHQGQVIIQSSKKARSKMSGQTAGRIAPRTDDFIIDTVGGGGGASSGSLSAGRELRVLDITDIIKQQYNNRVERLYFAGGGSSYSAMIAKTLPVSEWTGEATETTEMSTDRNLWNYRYKGFGTNYGYWLNDPWHHPKLIAGNIIEDPLLRGDKINLDNAGRFSSVSMYKTGFHPSGLCAADGTPTWDADNNKSGSDGRPVASNKWYFESSYDSNQYFVLDLLNTPWETDRRDWRNERPHWDCTNAKCGNPDCRIGGRGMTVGEWNEYMQSGVKSGPLPSMTSKWCCACGADLTVAPATGAVQVDGDGMASYFYQSNFEPDPFIALVNCEPTGGDITLDAYKGSYAIRYKNTTQNVWETLVEVNYDRATGMYQWIWNNVQNQSLTAPTSFVPTNVDGNYLRARYIMYDFYPNPTMIQYSGAGGSVSGACYLLNTGGTYPDDYFESAVLKVGPSGSSWSDTPMTVVSSRDNDILYLTTIPPSACPTWSLTLYEWRGGCAKFEVFGFNYTDEEMKITDPPQIDTFPFVQNTFALTNWPTKIQKVTLGSVYSGIELTRASSASTVSFTTTSGTLMSGETFYQITAGTYYYDHTTASIILATRDQGGRLITSMNSNLNSALQRKYKPSMVSVKYWTGIGFPIEVDVTPSGVGPSYQVEKDAITRIDTCMPGASTNNTKLGFQSEMLPDSYGNWDYRDLHWLVYNHDPMYGTFSTGYLSGLELQADWTYNNFVRLFGNTEASKVSGSVSGKATFYGPPDVVLTGQIVIAAPATTTHTFTDGDGETVTFNERTGGLQKTGFMLGVDLDASAYTSTPSYRKTLAWDVPTVLVYAKERDLGDSL